MPKITDISYQTKNKSRCNLFIDGEFFAGLSLEIVLQRRLKVGAEVDKSELLSIVEESDRKEALAKAADYVSRSLKTKRQVKDYIIRKGYSEEIAWYCVDKLKEYDYVNDEEFSKRYIESVSKNQGKRLVEYKLMMKGVRKEDIEKAYGHAVVNANENAKNVLDKYLRNKELNKENLVKAYRYLISKGFSYDEANFALSKLTDEED